MNKLITAEEARQIPIEESSQDRIDAMVAAVNFRITQQTRQGSRAAIIGISPGDEKQLRALSPAERNEVITLLKSSGYAVSDWAHPPYFQVSWEVERED